MNEPFDRLQSKASEVSSEVGFMVEVKPTITEIDPGSYVDSLDDYQVSALDWSISTADYAGTMTFLTGFIEGFRAARAGLSGLP